MVKSMSMIPIVFSVIILFMGCNTAAEEENIYSSAGNDPVASETEAGDFIIKLVSEKGIYQENEKVDIVARLKYIGEEEEIIIYYGDTPFLYEIMETTKGVQFSSVSSSDTDTFNEIVLERGVWYDESYDKMMSAKSASEFDELFFKGDGFPLGNYEIDLWSSFYTTEDSGEDNQHSYSTSIMIQVVEEN